MEFNLPSCVKRVPHSPLDSISYCVKIRSFFLTPDFNQLKSHSGLIFGRVQFLAIRSRGSRGRKSDLMGQKKKLAQKGGKGMFERAIRIGTGPILLIFLVLAFGLAHGQDYPAKPIEVIVGYPPGAERT